MKNITFNDSELKLLQSMVLIFIENTEKALKRQVIPSQRRQLENLLTEAGGIILKLTDNLGDINNES